MPVCIFCKIIAGEIPSMQQYSDDLCVAFNDIHPKDRVHILIVPRKHVDTLNDCADSEKNLLGHVLLVAKQLAAKHKCQGYRLQVNVGKSAGQEVFHLHVHLIGS